MADDLVRRMDAVARLKKAQEHRKWAEDEWNAAIDEAKAAGVAHQKIVKLAGITDPTAQLEMLQKLQRDS